MSDDETKPSESDEASSETDADVDSNEGDSDGNDADVGSNERKSDGTHAAETETEDANTSAAPKPEKWSFRRWIPADRKQIPPRTARALLVLAAFAAAVAAVVIIQGYSYVYGNVAVSVPQVLALLDSRLFQADICHSQVIKASPRIYVNGLVALTAKSGITDVPGAYFFWFIASITSYVAGLYAIGRRFGGRFAGALLAFFALAATHATIGSTDIIHDFRHFEPATPAIAIAVWGVYFCLTEKWTLGYAMYGVAALFQFLVGFLPGALMAPFLLWQAYSQRSVWKLVKPMIPFGIGLALVYVPMALAGATGSGTISSKEFVFLYAHVRNPHHVVPSAWPKRAWDDLGLFTLGGAAMIVAARALSKRVKGLLLTVVVCTWLGLLLNYLYVDVWASAFIAKLQLARCTPFSKLAILIALSCVAAENWKRGREGLALMLAVAPMDNFGGWYFAATGIAALQASTTEEKPGRLSRGLTLVVGAVALLFFLGAQGGAFTWDMKRFDAIAGPRTMGGPVLFALLAAPLLVTALLDRFRGALKWVLGTATAVVAVATVFWLATPPKSVAKYLTRHIETQWPPRPGPEHLARELRDITDPSAMVLVPPSFESFQFHSHRSAVVTFKCIPLSEKGLEEWGNRMSAVLGVHVGIKTSWRGDLDGLYYRRSAADLVRVAHQYGARYILTRVGAHRGMNAPVVAQERGWVVYDVANVNL